MDAVREAVDLSVEIDRPDVAQLVYDSVDYDAADAYEAMLREAVTERSAKAERDAEQAAERRLAEREAMYQREYDMAEATSPDALETVDALAQGIGAESLYDESTDPKVARAVMRSGGLLAESQRSAHAAMDTLGAINEEIKRGPGALVRPGTTRRGRTGKRSWRTRRSNQRRASCSMPTRRWRSRRRQWPRTTLLRPSYKS
jgi:hypothetical protein